MLILWNSNSLFRRLKESHTLPMEVGDRDPQMQVLHFIRRKQNTQRGLFSSHAIYNTVSKLGAIFLILLLLINPTFPTERRGMH